MRPRRRMSLPFISPRHHASCKLIRNSGYDEETSEVLVLAQNHDNPRKCPMVTRNTLREVVLLFLLLHNTAQVEIKLDQDSNKMILLLSDATYASFITTRTLSLLLTTAFFLCFVTHRDTTLEGHMLDYEPTLLARLALTWRLLIRKFVVFLTLLGLWEEQPPA
jgi:hypothetical protein